MPEPTPVALLAFIKETYDRDELETLCFQLSVQYDDLEGESREAKARELIEYMGRNGRLPELRAELARERPQKYREKFGEPIVAKPVATAPPMARSARGVPVWVWAVGALAVVALVVWGATGFGGNGDSTLDPTQPPTQAVEGETPAEGAATPGSVQIDGPSDTSGIVHNYHSIYVRNAAELYSFDNNQEKLREALSGWGGELVACELAQASTDPANQQRLEAAAAIVNGHGCEGVVASAPGVATTSASVPTYGERDGSDPSGFVRKYQSIYVRTAAELYSFDNNQEKLREALSGWGGELVACELAEASSDPGDQQRLVAAATIINGQGCGGKAIRTLSPTPTLASPARAEVTIEDFEFSPRSLTVRVGTTVVWTHEGHATHTVSADDGTFNSGSLSGGEHFEFTFDTVGTYAYYCQLYGAPGEEGMSGSIWVTE